LSAFAYLLTGRLKQELAIIPYAFATQNSIAKNGVDAGLNRENLALGSAWKGLKALLA
jgi:hypothetical protein